MKRAEVSKSCTEEGVKLFDAAFGRDDESILEDVIAAFEEVLGAQTKKKKKSTVDPANKNDHNKIRFLAYKFLSRRYGYNVERIPIPTLAEILVKATFPGTGVAEFTGFVPSSKARELDDSPVTAAEKGSGEGTGSNLKRARSTDAAAESTASAT